MESSHSITPKWIKQITQSMKFDDNSIYMVVSSTLNTGYVKLQACNFIEPCRLVNTKVQFIQSITWIKHLTVSVPVTDHS